ncbi:MAG: DUF4325 domain-containing protein [Pseudomonadota bacterium]
MAGVRRRGKQVRGFIIQNINAHPNDIAMVTMTEFGISRQAVNGHLQRLARQGVILAEGSTRARHYRLAPATTQERSFSIEGLDEHVVWQHHVLPMLQSLPDNVLDLWHYGFTEMLNNAVDHSEGTSALILVEQDPLNTMVSITDNGEGIFRRIRRLCELPDERHAVLELSKGKLTTDPSRHTGEGIFFSSRMYDNYAIVSGDVHFAHEWNKPMDWILETDNPTECGTTVFMGMSNHSARTVKEVFSTYATGEEMQFNKTVVPLNLARYGSERLVSRSQAKRILSQLDRFRIVFLDFEGVDTVGRAFIDEVFRVFKNAHPELELYWVNANEEIEQTIVQTLAVD